MKSKLIPNKTVIIIDFDGTLSDPVVNGQRVPSLMGILRDSNLLNEESTQKAKEVSAQYYPIELDPTVDSETKQLKMKEWWSKSFQIMAEGGFNKQMVEDIANHSLLQLRQAADDFLRWTHQNQVPVIIFSASGIGGDTIPLYLEKNNLLFPNISVLSNNLVFDQNGHLLHASEPIITSANKNGKMLVQAGVYQDGSKEQCLIVGDSLDDSWMAEGLSFDLIWKVVFASDRLEAFSEQFDQILSVESGFQPILELFAR